VAFRRRRNVGKRGLSFGPNDQRRKVLSGIFDSATATSDGIDRVEPCVD
jgi:hypothetical protein